MPDQIELRARIDGIPEVVHAADLLHPGWGTFDARPAVHSVRVGAPLPLLAEYYRGGLRLMVEPGSAFAYSNNGFATLGQLVEDVTGMPWSATSASASSSPSAWPAATSSVPRR